jgi:hypothetical protein
MRNGRNLVEWPDEGVPLERAGLFRHRLDSFLELVAIEPLAPEVKHEHLGQELFVLAPPAVAFADGDEHLDQQRPVQVVHELDELLAGVRQQRRVFARR